MNNAAMVIEFDDSSNREIEEAKTYYRKARAAGRKIVDMEGNPVEHFHPALQGFKILESELRDHEFAMRLINETGDETVIWDSRDPDEVKEAERRFKEYTDKGWKAYAVDASGKLAGRIRSFGADACEVVFKEGRDWKGDLKKFVESFKRVEMLPRTYPG